MERASRKDLQTRTGLRRSLGGREITGDERPRHRSALNALLPNAIAGVAIGTVEVAFAASFAALIFGGRLDIHLPSAIGLSLFSAMVLLAGISLLGTFPASMGSTQDIPAAILATVAASVAARLAPNAPETFLTVVLAIALSSVLVGGFFLLMGTLRLGNLARFVPYPVVGGFLGGTGALLMQGSFGVLTGSALTLAALPQLLQPDLLARWLPGVIFGLLLIVVVRRGGHFLLIPILFVAVIGIFYVVLLAGGGQIADAAAGGWLLGPFPEGGLWQPWMLAAVTQADWSIVAGQAANMATLLPLSALGLLLNASGIELAVRRDIDLDRELRAAGIANTLAGLGGGIPGYHAVSLSALAHQMRVRSRATGLAAGVICGITLFAGSGILSLFPRAAIGGLLFFVGLALVAEWVYDTWSQLPRAEYLVLVLIVAVIAVWEFLAGVVIGLAAAVVLFLVNYSRIDVVRHALTRTSYRSNVDRTQADQEYLQERGDQIQILRLQGFLFFGTANALFERARSRVTADDLPPLRSLVLDFRRVTGLDSSAAQSFAKICALADSERMTVVLTSVAEPLRRTLDAAGLSPERQPALRLLGDLDRGVQWCEERLLEERSLAAGLTDSAAPTDWDERTSGFDLALLQRYLERVDAPEGHVLMRQGDPADGLYFLASGRLTVHVRERNETVRLRTMGAGSVVGELTLYLGLARTATVVADRSSSVYRLSHRALDDMERGDPDLAAALHRWLAGQMARRIVDDVRTITALLD